MRFLSEPSYLVEYREEIHVIEGVGDSVEAAEAQKEECEHRNTDGYAAER